MAKYIDQVDAIKAVNEQNAFTMTRSALLDVLNSIPAADVVPVVHGRWIEDHDYLKCPECSVMVKWDFVFFDIGDWNYCPNCGAKMDGGEGDEAD